MLKIGIPFWKIGDNSFGSTLSYLSYIARFGEVIPLMPSHTVRKDLDLLVLPGGLDIDPETYGQIPEFYTSKPDIHKEFFDKRYLPQYVANKTPILGICRGHQAIAVHFGGKLIQDMHHETNKENDPYSTVHEILFEPFDNELKIKFPNNFKLKVNSRHHQAVSRKFLPDCLACVASHDVDRTVEMIAHKDLPIVGVQWHPEDVYDIDSCRFMGTVVRFLANEKTSIF